MWIQVVFVIHRAVGPLHLAVPRCRALGYEAVGDAPLGQVLGKGAPELAAVVGLYAVDRERQAVFGELERGYGRASVPRRHVHGVLHVGYGIQEAVLVQPSPVPSGYVFHVNLDVFAWSYGDIRFLHRTVPFLHFPRFPDEAAFQVHFAYGVRGYADAQLSLEVQAHFLGAVVASPLGAESLYERSSDQLGLRVHPFGVADPWLKPMVPAVPFMVRLARNPEYPAGVFYGSPLHFHLSVPAETHLLGG